MRMRIWPILEQIEYIMFLKAEVNDQIGRMILQTLSQHNLNVHLNKAKEQLGKKPHAQLEKVTSSTSMNVIAIDFLKVGHYARGYE